MEPDEESGGETPEQLRERAEGLRECARQARTLAETIGPFIDGEAESAQANDPAIWEGPYAEATTQWITERRSTMNSMAGALLNDATRWETEADDLDARADESEGGN